MAVILRQRRPWRHFFKAFHYLEDKIYIRFKFHRFSMFPQRRVPGSANCLFTGQYEIPPAIDRINLFHFTVGSNDDLQYHRSAILVSHFFFGIYRCYLCGFPDRRKMASDFPDLRVVLLQSSQSQAHLFVFTKDPQHISAQYLMDAFGVVPAV